MSLDDAGDPVFASRALGEGVGIQPTDSTVVAPVSGVLQTVAETGHAFGLKTDDGIEVLVHVGIDTVKMNGEGLPRCRQRQPARERGRHAGDRRL